MDIEPIYCAEQIVIPPDLADTLKAYTKEVIRRQPEDLLEFSAIYFANLANVSHSLDQLVPPSVEQLRAIYQRLKGTSLVRIDDFVELCSGEGIADPTIKNAFRLSSNEDDMVDPKEMLVLLLTMTGENFLAVIKGMFDVFSEEGKLSPDEFMSLFGFLAAKDADISASAQSQLAGDIGDAAETTFEEVAELEIIKELGETLSQIM